MRESVGIAFSELQTAATTAHIALEAQTGTRSSKGEGREAAKLASVLAQLIVELAKAMNLG